MAIIELPGAHGEARNRKSPGKPDYQWKLAKAVVCTASTG